jgi:hypothetical protein
MPTVPEVCSYAFSPLPASVITCLADARKCGSHGRLIGAEVAAWVYRSRYSISYGFQERRRVQMYTIKKCVQLLCRTLLSILQNFRGQSASSVGRAPRADIGYCPPGNPPSSQATSSWNCSCVAAQPQAMERSFEMTTEKGMLSTQLSEPLNKQRSQILGDCRRALEQIYPSLKALADASDHIDCDALEREKLKQCWQALEALHWQFRELSESELD